MWIPQLWDGLVVCRSLVHTWSDSRVILSVSLVQQAQLVRIRQSFPDGRSELDSWIVSFFCENPSRIEYPDVVCQHISSSSVFMISLRSFRRRQSLAELSFSVGQHHIVVGRNREGSVIVMKSGMIRVGCCLSSQPVEAQYSVRVGTTKCTSAGPSRSGLDGQIPGVSLGERNFGLGRCL